MIKRLPYKIFLKTFQYVPRLAISLIVKNNRGEILLTKRAIPPMKNYWHLPGSFLLKNETIKSCINRILKNELSLKAKKSPNKFIGVFENINNDPRGHVVDAVYQLRMQKNFKNFKNKESKEAKFFDKLPTGIVFNHRNIIKQSI